MLIHPKIIKHRKCLVQTLVYAQQAVQAAATHDARMGSVAQQCQAFCALKAKEEAQNQCTSGSRWQSRDCARAVAGPLAVQTGGW